MLGYLERYRRNSHFERRWQWEEDYPPAQSDSGEKTSKLDVEGERRMRWLATVVLLDTFQRRISFSPVSCDKLRWPENGRNTIPAETKGNHAYNRWIVRDIRGAVRKGLEGDRSR
jgi:hypothetical protein